jgi:hypothetical protein
MGLVDHEGSLPHRDQAVVQRKMGALGGAGKWEDSHSHAWRDVTKFDRTYAVTAPHRGAPKKFH